MNEKKERNPKIDVPSFYAYDAYFTHNKNNVVPCDECREPIMVSTRPGKLGPIYSTTCPCGKSNSTHYTGL